jgi:DNA-binding CsgD family transcriptional regulator
MPGRAKDISIRITDAKILSMTEEIIQLTFDNPDGLDLADQINKRLLSFVQYDFYHYVMDVSSPEPLESRLDFLFEKWERLGAEDEETSVLMPPSKEDWTFEQTVDNQYRGTVERMRKKHPNQQAYYYYRITSSAEPKIVLGFFRRKGPKNRQEFSSEERAALDYLAPHIFLLYRLVLKHVHVSEAFQYFSSFSRLGSKLANDHNLSSAEVKLIPDILFGQTNEQIAERYFISVTTVKSHIKHILRKTGTKNRIDLISKFFTSPEHIRL